MSERVVMATVMTLFTFVLSSKLGRSGYYSMNRRGKGERKRVTFQLWAKRYSLDLLLSNPQRRATIRGEVKLLLLQ